MSPCLPSIQIHGETQQHIRSSHAGRATAPTPSPSPRLCTKHWGPGTGHTVLSATITIQAGDIVLHFVPMCTSHASMLNAACHRGVGAHLIHSTGHPGVLLCYCGITPGLHQREPGECGHGTGRKSSGVEDGSILSGQPGTGREKATHGAIPCSHQALFLAALCTLWAPGGGERRENYGRAARQQIYGAQPKFKVMPQS